MEKALLLNEEIKEQKLQPEFTFSIHKMKDGSVNFSFEEDEKEDWNEAYRLICDIKNRMENIRLRESFMEVADESET